MSPISDGFMGLCFQCGGNDKKEEIGSNLFIYSFLESLRKSEKEVMAGQGEPVLQSGWPVLARDYSHRPQSTHKSSHEQFGRGGIKWRQECVACRSL